MKVSAGEWKPALDQRSLVKVSGGQRWSKGVSADFVDLTLITTGIRWPPLVSEHQR